MSQLPIIILSGLLVVLNSGPMYWQVKQGNSGAISMGVWVIVENLLDFINYTVWFNDEVNRAPIFCDISVKLQIGGEVGRIASVMCIARFLAEVVSPRATAITRQDRRRRAIFDYSMCFGAPALVMASHIVYQPDRYAIVRGMGCTITANMTWPTIVLWLIWPPIFALIGVLYSAYTVYRLVKHRRDFGRVVAGAHSALTTSRFIRLAALSFSYLLIGLPLCLYTTIANIASAGSYIDYSWSYLHATWYQYPVIYFNTPTVAGLATWSDVIVGAIFFAAFGFGTEAMALYSRAAELLGITRITCLSRSARSKTAVANGRQTGLSRPSHADYSTKVMGRETSASRNGVRITVDREEELCTKESV